MRNQTDVRRRRVILRVARQHRVGSIRWWPPAAGSAWVDLIVETAPGGPSAFRSDLERALGCRVAVHLAGQIPKEAWGRLLVETVAV